jgi:hypothetical protein
MSEKVIITDIDSTMSDHWKRIRRNTEPYWPGGKIASVAFTSREVLQDKLLPSCLTVLNELQVAGFHIRYLSARGWPRAWDITVEQLTNWGVPNPQDLILCTSMAEKVGILEKEACTYYVDDFMTGQENSVGTFHHGVAKAIMATGIRVIVFRNDWHDVWEQIQYYEHV